MTRKDFDSMVADATTKGEELKQSKRRGNGNGAPRRPSIQSLVDADVAAHPGSDWEDVVRRCAIALGMQESAAAADGFVKTLTSCSRLPRLARACVAEAAE